MPLIRLTPATWIDLERAWKAECEKFDESLDDYAAPSFEHARSIVHEPSQKSEYGVFALNKENNFQAIMHVNAAYLPKTTGKTLRIVWVLLAPAYDFDDIDLMSLASVAADIISGAVDLARIAEMNCQHIKVHIGNAFDRTVFTSVRLALRRSGVEMALKGNWAHLDQQGAA